MKIKEPSFQDNPEFIYKNRGEHRKGNNAIVWSNPATDLKKRYKYTGKRRLGYKVFYRSEYTPKLNKFSWKKENPVPLEEVTFIQNLFWMEGMAPRVLDVITFESSEKLYYAQVTELLEEDEQGPWTDETMAKARKFMEERSIMMVSMDHGPFHCYKDKFVDFGDFRILDKNKYEEGLKERVIKETSYGNRMYQTIPDLKIEGVRKFKERLPVLKFDEENFIGKTALVFGCNAGVTCQEIAKRGAARVIGIDFPNVAKAAQELAFYLGYNNIEFYGCGSDYEKIKELTGLSQFDIVTYFACFQMGWPDFLKDLVKETFFLEGHKQQEKKTHMKLLKGIFLKVKYLGQITDDGSRPVYKCTYE